MGNCLITQLKESVNNDNLLILGGMRIKNNVVSNPTANTQSITFHNLGNDVTLEIINNDTNNSHHFTDSNLEADLGISLVSPGDWSYYTVYVTPGSEILVKKKYDLLSLIEITIDALIYNSWSFNINDLQYNSINNLRLTKSCIGDAVSLKGKVFNNFLYPVLNRTESYGIKGGIKGIIINASPKFISEVGSASTGNPYFVEVEVTDFQYDNLNTINAPRSFVVSGDLAKLGKNCNFINIVKENVAIVTWTYRPETYAATVLQNVNLGDSLGAYLKNIAGCDHSVEPESKSIVIHGTYDTTDADLAEEIATIKGWSGYSISINGSLV